jgi:hypothetical protein
MMIFWAKGPMMNQLPLTDTYKHRFLGLKHAGEL